MSEKNLRYSHPKYCLERTAIETPTEIPIPNIKVKNDEGLKNKNVLPVKNIKLKRSKTVVIEEQPTIEYKPSFEKPIVVEPILNAHDIFRNQINARIEVRKHRYNKLLEGAF